MKPIPDHYRSPRGHTWAVQCAFNLESFARRAFPDELLPDDVREPAWVNDYYVRLQIGLIARGRSTVPHIAAENDHVALMRVAEDAEGYPRMLGTYLPRSEIALWEPVEIDLEAKREYLINGERAYVRKLHTAFAVMRWSAPMVDFPNRPLFFPLWRFELALAALGPVEFLMMSETYTAKDDEL